MMNTRTLIKLGLGILLVVVLLMAGTYIAMRANQSPAAIAKNQGSAGSSQLALVQENAISALAVPAAQAASVTIDLCATTGTVSLPGGATAPIWSFVLGGTCVAGDATLPGPELRVNAGDMVTINLTNNLAESVSILIPGQNVTSTGGAAGIFTQEAAPGGTVSYAFTAQEGTYLYESGSNTDVQVAMGLYGALVVNSGLSGQAYGNSFDQEAVLLLSEIDPNLNADPAGFNMQNYKPTYWLINGQAYPDTSPIAANAGEMVLLRYLNVGYDNLSMAILGAHQTLIAKEGFAVPMPMDLVAEIVAAGQTMDTIVDTTGLSGSLALYNRNMYLTNGALGLNHYPGGLMTFLDVQAPVGNPPSVSIASPADGATVAGTITVQIAASDIEDDAVPVSLAVEWRVNGGMWQSATYNGGTGYYEDSWDTTLLSDGSVTFEARATDSDNNTTTTAQFMVTIDNIDELPTVSIFNPMDGDLVTGSITIQANASDDHAVAQVEFFDGATSLGVDTDGSDGWSALWNTAGDGPHTLEARATDDGIPANTSSDFINVTVDNTAPSVSISAPAGGDTVSGLVTIMANALDATSGVSQVEFFVDGNSIGVDANGGDGWSADWDTIGLNTGGYSLTATATDGVGLSATSAAVNVTVDNPAQNTLHVGDLNAVTVLQNPGQNNERWTATVTVMVHDATEASLGGAEVSFDVAWINNNNGNTQTASLSCTTGAAGQCQVSRQFQSGNTEDIVSFTVTGISHASLTYEPLDNHDPDPDPGPDVVDNMFSDGTTIQVEVQRP